MKLLLLILLVAASSQAPVERCFSGGIRFQIKTSTIGGNELCLKDDIAMYKVDVTYNKADQIDNKIKATMTATVKEIIANWKECNPILAENGNLNIISIDENFMISTRTYACSAACEIQIDKQHAKIILQSPTMNYYSIKGTTYKNGWFKNNFQLELENTCENVEITCGPTLIRLHSCFKEHMSCIRFLHGKILSFEIATSICANIELIISIVMVLIVFAILWLMSKTYICYILIPIFLPISYVYSKFYNLCCKSCKNCGLAVHPFTSCSLICVCGSRFESTNRLLMHRNSGMCTGFKTLRSTRYFCKSKGCNFLLALLLSFLFLNFITPINADCIEESELIDKFQLLLKSDREHANIAFVLNIAIPIVTLLILSMILLLEYMYIFFLRLILIECPECNMYHTKLGLRYNGDFTNKCGLCTCGELDDIEGLKMHKKRPNCAIKYKTITYKNILLFSVLIILLQLVAVNAEVKPLIKFKECLEESEMSVDCLPEFIPYKCKNTEKVKTTVEMFELIGVHRLPFEIGEGDFETISSIQVDTTYSKKYLGYVNRIANCKYYEKLLKGQNTWMNFAKKNPLPICQEMPTVSFCKCLNGTCTANSMDLKGKNITTSIEPMKKVYQRIFNGISCEFISYAIDHNRDKTLTALLIKSQQLFTNNAELKALFYLINDIGKVHTGLKLGPTIAPLKKGSVDISNVIIHSELTECVGAKLLGCSDRHSTNIERYILCSIATKKAVYKYIGSLTKAESSDNTCLNDNLCHTPFIPLTTRELVLFKAMVCNETQLSRSAGSPIVECYPIKYGSCTVAGNSVPTVQCTNELIYKRKDPIQPGREPGMVALPVGGSVPLDILEGSCKWIKDTMDKMSIEKKHHEDLQHFKESITQKLHNDLIIHKFLPTANLPHISPQFQYISILGQESDNGITSSYVLFDIGLISGASTGLHLRHKKELLYDLVVFIKSARIQGTYQPIYKTGPTIGINLKHEEKCTGSCPAIIQKPTNWLSFTIERTSRWTCEEFGCLAINTGCLYGSCNDIIKPVATVYRLQGVPDIITEICITYPDETTCKTMIGESLAISETIEIQLEKVEAFKLPDLIYYEDNKVFTGDINDLGSYAKKCGNVQMIGNGTHGMGNPKIDYTCHLAKRKDVIARRCFDNNYQSCKLLRESNYAYNHTDKSMVLSDNTKNLGIAKIKMHLGDIDYKLFSKEIDLSVDGHCFGCIDCFNNIDCTLNVHVDSLTICEIKSDCKLSTNRLLLKEDNHKYHVKAYCTSKMEQLEIEICGKSTSISLDLSLAKDKIELDIADQTTYIREKDNRCGTWLCKVLDEGINLNIFSGFGMYITIIIAVIIGIIFLLFMIYVLIPCCSKAKEVLKGQEYMMLRELKQR
ncbi:polyprotein, partial [Salt ash virus]|uniref:Envelopment polyprotein n=2 Tax=Orthobunyavirus ganganense TaxID=3052394 RepID=A0A1L2YWH1_9VIRU